MKRCQVGAEVLTFPVVVFDKSVDELGPTISVDRHVQPPNDSGDQRRAEG